MADEQLRAEIESLRKQLNDMQKERQATAATAAAEEEKDEREDEEPTATQAETLPVESEEEADLAAHFKELLDSIDKDLKEAKPTTLLIVFALGVLIGRLGR